MAAKRWPDLGKDVGTRASRREGGPHGGARRKALPARRPWEEISGQWQGGGAGSGEVRPGNPLVSEVGRGPREYAGWALVVDSPVDESSRSLEAPTSGHGDARCTALGEAVRRTEERHLEEGHRGGESHPKRRLTPGGGSGSDDRGWVR
ncbi:leucine-rich repeat extensin-like protein 3 [Iris pallida]|uniref:Leucine-rich repeat extensin-like protein 3 n=1 Tax=Iris pallida TaxID=29817 RepID=A0AAX6GD75_IRIPA|nr:leucine-rich repeat extensin-like protein 3 [Iris pallida]